MPSAEGQFVKLYSDLPDSEQAEILKEQMERFSASLKYMQTLYPGMIANFKKYRSIAEPLTDETGREVQGRSNLFVPYPYAIVESELPRLAGKLPRIRIFPRNPANRKDVEIRQDYLYYVFDRMNFLHTQTLWLRQYSIYGWSPLHYYWREEYKPILSKEIGPDGNPALVKKKAKCYDDFWCHVVDVFDSFIQPGVVDINDSDWFMFRQWLSKKDVKAMVDAGLLYPQCAKYVEDNRAAASSWSTDGGRGDRDALIGQTKDVSPQSYGKYELMYTLEDGKIIAMLDRAVLAKVGDNPNPLQEKPIINCNLSPMVGEPIGVGTVEALAGLPDKLNAITNARLDNISLLLGKVFLVNRNAQVDLENFVMDSGNLILTDDPNNTMKELEFTDFGISAEREILTTKEEMQFVSGVSDYIVGVKSGSRISDTATGVSTIVREANAKYALKQAAYEAGALRKLVQAADSYSRVLMTDEKKVFVAGPDGYREAVVTPEDLTWEADLIVEPGSSVPLDQYTRREALMNLLDRAMKSPQIVNIPRIWREVFEAFDFRDVDEIVNDPDSGEIADEVRYAEGENIAFGMGETPHLYGDDQVHSRVHLAPIQNKEWESWPMPYRQNLLTHIKMHQAKLQEQAVAQQGGLNAQAGNATVPPGPGTVAGPQPPGQPPGVGEVSQMVGLTGIGQASPTPGAGPIPLG